jgi:hypothetical protein
LCDEGRIGRDPAAALDPGKLTLRFAIGDDTLAGTGAPLTTSPRP